MKNSTAFFLAVAIFATAGCSSMWPFNKHNKQPKSSFKIIEEGDRNPFIIDTPEKIKDTPTQRIEVETGPVGAQ